MNKLELIEEVEIDLTPPPCPPTQDELPYEDGILMESERYKLQMELLLETLQPWLAQRGEGYAGGNMFLYFSLAQTRGQYFRGPDVFVALGILLVRPLQSRRLGRLPLERHGVSTAIA
ncbi:MAG: hypothetical protein U1F42_05770 [Candidatus Competibacteraceae bacterium]